MRVLAAQTALRPRASPNPTSNGWNRARDAPMPPTGNPWRVNPRAAAVIANGNRIFLAQPARLSRFISKSSRGVSWDWATALPIHQLCQAVSQSGKFWITPEKTRVRVPRVALKGWRMKKIK